MFFSNLVELIFVHRYVVEDVHQTSRNNWLVQTPFKSCLPFTNTSCRLFGRQSQLISRLQFRHHRAGSHLAADGGDPSAAGLWTLIHGGELSLVVHLQQLQSSGAVAHLGGTGMWTGYIELKQIYFKYDQVRKTYPLVVWVDSNSHHSASGQTCKIRVLELLSHNLEERCWQKNKSNLCCWTGWIKMVW